MNNDELKALSWEEVNSYIDTLEKPLIDELGILDEQAMTNRDRRNRRRDIRDEREGIWRIRARWRSLHRSPDAGPDQFVG